MKQNKSRKEQLSGEFCLLMQRRQQATNGTTWNSKCAQEFLVQSETAATLERYSIDFVFLLWMFNCSSKKPVKEAELHTFSWLVWYQSAPQTDRVGMQDSTSFWLVNITRKSHIVTNVPKKYLSTITQITLILLGNVDELHIVAVHFCFQFSSMPHIATTLLTQNYQGSACMHD